MRKLLLGAATVITSLGLTAGVAAAQTGGGSISDTGPDSTAIIRTKIKTRTYLKNKNDLHVANNTSQTALSGNAIVEDNTDGDDATTGEASNTNSLSVAASVDNNTADTLAAALTGVPGYAGGGDISDTGPDSYAKISTKVYTDTTVKNYNTLYVSNNTDQTALSGDAEVSHNTDGGDATSGDANNTNSTSVTLNVSN